MVLKEKFEDVLKAAATLRESALVFNTTLKEFDECVAQSQKSVMDLDSMRDRLKAAKAEYAKVSEQLVIDEKKLGDARAALAKLKEMHL